MNDYFDDKPHDECGVFGIYAPGREVARLTFFGLYALQHRGQESAGIASSDGQMAYSHKGMGLVAQVFNEDNLRPLQGHLAIGHNRYSTTGSSHLRNVQPYLIETIYGPLGVSHNGNLTNALHLRHQLLKRGVGLSSTSDSEVITQILAAPAGVWTTPEQNGQESDRWVARLQAFMQVAEGAYSLAILARHAIYAIRDPLGLRPLCLGRLEGGGYVVASESCALHTVGADYLREVEPGEIIRLDEAGLASFTGRRSERRALCIFEYVYFARPDSLLEGQTIHGVRQRLGRQLAREAPAEADIVVGVPDSATPAAIGYSLESGLPFTEGLTKNRYIGRTFIQPDDQLRKEGVRIKYNPLSANLRGKRVVLVDDSIIRGNTAGPLVQLLREGGASEVHVRVSSPPVRHPCFMGVDMATYQQLIAHRLDVEGIRQRIGAESLAYLSLPGMEQAVREAVAEANHPAGSPETGHCTACFSGRYPITIPDWLFSDERDKLIFEDMWG
ncbi:MAG: amidophosphoribosyltransferase [Chloroflexi bacterium]|nr:amidophosphoribosyltransferase [Chloroflexota bacterium]MCI0578149.1 amidophosphoribosyltransferase [Chloroflexota bacterium]MCI0649857.1 amidophosphoribosyltransferase [Chloroflexota bacterium]MCI0730281.1 amidophosphoribosyltransferase [Chloroflexota bacterium]